MKTREIKFRAWSKLDNKFLFPYPEGFVILGETTCFDLIMNQMKEMHSDKTTLSMLNDVEIMQFTGLLDKNRKEIYEGDIIELYGGSKKKTSGQIIFEDGCFCFKAPWIKEGNSYPELKYYTIFAELSGDKLFKDCILTEIIGNIFENPELLK